MEIQLPVPQYLCFIVLDESLFEVLNLESDLPIQNDKTFLHHLLDMRFTQLVPVVSNLQDLVLGREPLFSSLVRALLQLLQMHVECLRIVLYLLNSLNNFFFEYPLAVLDFVELF